MHIITEGFRGYPETLRIWLDTLNAMAVASLLREATESQCCS